MFPDRMPDGLPDRMPDRMLEDMPEDMPDRVPEDMPEHTAEDMPEDMLVKMPEDMSDRMPEDLPVTKRINVMVVITRSNVIIFSACVQYMYYFEWDNLFRFQTCWLDLAHFMPWGLGDLNSP